MSFDTEVDAFRAYADCQPGNCVLLVDTYDTIQGVRHAVDIGRGLRAHGRRLAGIRLDSGDLVSLSVAARRLLDEAGLHDTVIVASGDLDEARIAQLKQQGAAISVWGVGTRLATAFDEPALTGVYKLAATREPGGDWTYRIKISDHAAKTTTPGILQVRRCQRNGVPVADILYDDVLGLSPNWGDAAPVGLEGGISADPGTGAMDLLVPVFRAGTCVYDPPPLHQVREHAARQVAGLPPGVVRREDPETYPVCLDPTLQRLKQSLIRDAKGQTA
jgi:nicotinate phosphoribosyltransferase